jgi:hypothetical protein
VNPSANSTRAIDIDLCSRISYMPRLFNQGARVKLEMWRSGKLRK